MVPGKGLLQEQQNKRPQLKIIEWLLRFKAKGGIRSLHFWIISGLLVVFAYIYYTVVTAYYDVYAILFFYPLMYAAIAYRLRGVTISGLIFLGILLPHAVLFAYDSYLLVRLLLFAAFAFLVSGLTAALLNYLERQMEAYAEILSLNEELNDYIERLKNTRQQLIQAEKLNALGQLAASVAHEINNPLAGVLVYSKLLSKRLQGGPFDKDEALSNLSKIESAVSHCSKIIHGLLNFARQSEPVLQPVVIGSVIDQAMSLVGHEAEMKGVEIIREETSPLPPVMADFGQLQQVFVNLVINAIQATPNGGKLIIRSSIDDGWVKVALEDTGHGIPPENMEKLFTPFFTTKEPGKGVGLGLAVSYGIIERHGGKIEVQSEVGKGSTFTVHLPAYQNDTGQLSQPGK
jgi:signal transduction histidine kinase